MDNPPSYNKPPFPPPFAPPTGAGAPKPVGGPKPLVLPRRVSPLQRAQEASVATAAAKRSIEAIFSQSRAPWGGQQTLTGNQVAELEKAIRALEAKVAERDALVAEAQARLADRERELAEAEALLAARERVIEAAKSESQKSGASMTKEEEDALKKLKEELDRQEESIKEQRQALKEREEFLDQSETALFTKMQQQQEKESEIEQREEDLKRAMRAAGLLKNEPTEPKEKA